MQMQSPACTSLLTFSLAQAAVPHLEKTKGSIVNISSIAGVKPTVPMFTYAVTKAGSPLTLWPGL